ncbi:MAG TPA: hypothetical protein VN915_11860 [Elusimicrobiota bacterium]|nr:hypothetical protein [Elusimicrobiota bacterium]
MKKTTTLLALAAAFAALSMPASAAVSVGADQTFGTSNYRGTKANASIDLSDSWYVSPTFSTYRTDNSSGSYYQGGLRVGYELGPLSLGLMGAFVPKNDGYRQNSVGADLTFSLAPGHTKHGHRMAGPASESNETYGYGLAGVDLGGSVVHVTHSDDFKANGTSGDALRQQGAPRANAFTVGETDLTAFAGLKFLITEISASVSKSLYDKDLDNNRVRESPFMPMGEFAAIESGFPESSYNGKIKWTMLPFVKPYVSFTHTNFKLGSAPSNATEAGVNVGLDMLNVKGAYGHYGQNGFTARNYFTLGASLNFGE